MHTERILPMPPERILLEVLRNLMIRKIDQQWQDHLLSIDHLRAEIQLRSVGQKDPLLEFKHEAFHLFESFSKKVKLEIARDLFKFEIVQPQRSRVEETSSQLQMDTHRSFLPEQEEILETKEESTETTSEEPSKPSPIVSAAPKIERNAACPCGSGKKYKKCCGALVSEKI
jgi:preprotein translocase subunit SecA